MFGRILALIVKEILANIRDRQTGLVLLIVPTVELFLFAFAAQDVTNVTLAVANRDAGAYGRELVSRFEASGAFSQIDMLDTDAAIAGTIDSRKAIMVLRIAQQFSADVAGGRPASVQIILDGRRSNASQILLGYAQRIVSRFANELPARDNALPSPSIETRVWFNPTLNSVWSTVPGIFATLTAVVCILVSAFSVSRERELGTFEQLLVSPLSSTEIMIGKLAAGVVFVLASSSLLLFLSVFVLGVPFVGNLGLIYVGLLAYSLSILGIGIFISSLADTQQQSFVYTYAFLAPAFVLSGYATPIEAMPNWLQAINQANPIFHFVSISKGLFLSGIGVDVVVGHLVPLMLIAAFTVTAATFLFRSRTT